MDIHDGDPIEERAPSPVTRLQWIISEVRGYESALWCMAVGGVVRVWQCYEHDLYASSVLAASTCMSSALLALAERGHPDAQRMAELPPMHLLSELGALGGGR